MLGAEAFCLHDAGALLDDARVSRARINEFGQESRATLSGPAPSEQNYRQRLQIELTVF
jgi:hypothetical protein